MSARERVVEPRVCLLPGHRRSLLRRLEPPHRPALDHHVHRPPEMGQCMMISAGWYYKNGPGEINEPVSIGGWIVNPGDIVVGTRAGSWPSRLTPLRR